MPRLPTFSAWSATPPGSRSSAQTSSPRTCLRVRCTACRPGNINQSNRLSFRFNYLNSYRDVLASNSGSFQDRRSNAFALNFSNSNYVINNDIYSGIVELNSIMGSKFSNQIQLGFTANRDYRSSGGGVFPLVDILQDGRIYTTFGYEPFTPNNVLNTDTWQFQDNFTLYNGAHTITAGVNFEAFKFENTFTPTYYGQFVYNSLQDFYDDGNDTKDSIQVRRYALTYSALEGGKFVSNNATDLQFQNVVVSGDTFSVAQQQAAFQTFIDNDDYLSSHKGKYTERNGVLLPWLTTIDLSVQQEVFVKVGERRHTLQFRADFYNFGNLLNNKWGVGDVVRNNFPLRFAQKDANTKQPVYTFAPNSSGVFPTAATSKDISLASVWQAQLGVRYIF